jgi:hypothetical protein
MQSFPNSGVRRRAHTSRSSGAWLVPAADQIGACALVAVSAYESTADERPYRAHFLRRLTLTALLGDNDAHAKNVGIMHLPGRRAPADVYDAVPNLFQQDPINCDLALGYRRRRS